MKRLTILAALLALAAAWINAQDAPKKTEKLCRSLEETYYLVGPDEVFVDGKVCKKETPAPPRISALDQQTQSPGPAATSSVAAAPNQTSNPAPSVTAIPTPTSESDSTPTTQLAATAEARQLCTKVVSFGYMAPGEQGHLLHPNIPDGTSKGWLNNWVRKNAQRYPDVCFLPNPLRGRTNY